MRRVIALILAVLLLPALPFADADANLIDVGVIETEDGRFMHASFTSPSTICLLYTSDAADDL